MNNTFEAPKPIMQEETFPGFVALVNQKFAEAFRTKNTPSNCSSIPNKDMIGKHHILSSNAMICLHHIALNYRWASATCKRISVYLHETKFAFTKAATESDQLISLVFYGHPAWHPHMTEKGSAGKYTQWSTSYEICVRVMDLCDYLNFVLPCCIISV